MTSLVVIIATQNMLLTGDAVDEIALLSLCHFYQLIAALVLTLLAAEPGNKRTRTN